MSNIGTIRTMVADPIRYTREDQEGDGFTTKFILLNSPVVPDSEEVQVGDTLVVTGYTLDDDLGLLEFDIAPSETVTVTVTYKFSILSDAQIQSLLDLEGGAIRRAAADCLEAIAADQVLVLKRIKLLDLDVDGPAMAKELRELAKSLRDQEAEGVSVFEVAEFAPDPFGSRERLWNEMLRNQ